MDYELAVTLLEAAGFTVRDDCIFRGDYRFGTLTLGNLCPEGAMDPVPISSICHFGLNDNGDLPVPSFWNC